ncbi:male-specific lethal 3 homolog isoform X1 [Microplitis mediator]|uniref:male-specific lethal 3 homolog isoform X1 n=1 Tax=Microplitis mediator TaxID=375433 RepID=UPI002555B48E|nr:male-specific lethal 3 homolog isoform X1 [Microplitis mediator]
MVSTRGPKFKFCDGEKVLCYEPDPTKAKVLYDSKVLDVIVNKDQRGRKAVEYLIHFQGWNSSWDRCVTEEYVLKDTEENRQLQRDLAQKAQLQLGAYLYRRERKNRTHRLADRLSGTGIESRRRARSGGSRATSGTTSEDGSSGQQDDYDTEEVITEEDSETSSNFGGESSEDEDSGGGGSHQSSGSMKPGIDLDIGSTLRRILEQDYELINHKNKLAVLPAQPTVCSILESWVQHFTTTQLTNIPEKPQRNNRSSNTIEKTVNEINICREVADGLRIYFDFTLPDLLLYRTEREQYNAFKSSFLLGEHPIDIKEEIIESPEVTVKEELEDSEYAHLPPFRELDAEVEQPTKPVSSVKRKLRSSRVSSVDDSRQLRSFDEVKQEAGNVSSIASTSSRCSSPRGATSRYPLIPPAQIVALLDEANKWRLIPESTKNDGTPSPSTYFGAIHLARLFVKLPDLLQNTDMPEKKLKVLLKYIDMFLSYLEPHREWFGEQFYMQTDSQSQ